ncbi:MAG: methylenetetrahydrofolate reductase [Sedimentisphaerales bacterium]|nr:methylenetetrahydrofolate reductase [Sedimentisphaerales bacterium]
MVATQYKSGSNLEKVLASGDFAVTAELGPPKSVDLDVIKNKAQQLVGWVDAVNITDNQTAIVRVSSIATGKLVIDMGLEPIMQMTCRDRNRLAVQADILGAYLLGIRNMLCLTGDHMVFGNHPTARYVFDLDSIQLIQMVKDMRDEKVFASGEEIRNSKKADVMEPRMFIGGAANPFADPFEFRVIRLEKKINAGMDFVQTQCIYDMDRFRQWMEQVRNKGLHEKCKILAGVTPLKSAGMAKYMRDKVAGVAVPDYYIDRMAKAEDPGDEGINICVEQIQRLRQIEGVAGIHIMAIEWEQKVSEIVEKAQLKRNSN